MFEKLPRRTQILYDGGWDSKNVEVLNWAIVRKVKLSVSWVWEELVELSEIIEAIWIHQNTLS